MFKAIIFDFGGVFSKDDNLPEFWRKNGARFGVDPEAANRVGIPVWSEARLGKIDSRMYWEKIGAFIIMDPGEFKKYFIEYTGFRDELYDYVKKNLKGRYKLAILSNQIESWLGPILEEKKFREVFDVIVTSYDTGVAKPDIEIYQKVIQELGVRAEECVYVEDRPKNLEPARRLGMRTVEFKGYTRFVEDLEKLLVN